MVQTDLDWSAALERGGRAPRGSAIRDLLAVTERPDVISFAGGLPAPELFPAEGLRAAFDAVLREDAGGALQYGPTPGYRPLRELVAERLGRRGIACDAEDVVVTTGSQQALDLLGRVLAGPGMEVLVESPSYVGALQALSAREVSFVACPGDEHGLRADLLRRSRGTALLYTVPTFQNPSGGTMGLERRRQLLSCTRDLGLPVVE